MSRRARERANARPWETPERTGWPPGMLQDDCRGLSIWLASKPDARMRAREAAAAIQEPDDDQATGDASDGCGDGDEGEDEDAD